MRFLVVGLVVLLLGLPAAAAGKAAAQVVVLDPGHDLRANPATEPIGPGSATRKIKDGGGTHGVVSGLSEADLNLRVALRLRPLLEHAGVRVVMTRTKTAGTQHREHRARPDRKPGWRRALPSHPRRRLDRSERARDAHAVSRAAGRVDRRHLRGEQSVRRGSCSRSSFARSAFPTVGSRSVPTSPASTGQTCRRSSSRWAS